MDILDQADAVGTLRSFLLARGLTVEIIQDYSRVADLVGRAGKEYLTPFSSPNHNDFTSGNCIWLCASDVDGPVLLGAARLEDLGSEPLDQYWARIFHRAYDGAEIEHVSSYITGMAGGRLVYFGDLFVARRLRGARINLQAFTAIGHLLCSLKWSPDWVYCFLRGRDVARGAAHLYGFSLVERRAYRWKSVPPHTRSNDECAAFLPQAGLPAVIGSVLDAILAEPVQPVLDPE